MRFGFAYTLLYLCLHSSFLRLRWQMFTRFAQWKVSVRQKFFSR